MIGGVPEAAFESKVLDKEFHRPLIDDLPALARAANIPVQTVWTSMVGVCTHAEIEYVRGLRRKSLDGVSGLVYLGASPSLPMTNRMMAMAGACLRNYIDARVMTLDDLLQGLKLGSLGTPTVLLVPNFFVGVKDGGKVAEWQISGLLSMLYSRQAEGLQTVLYVKSLTELSSAYGAAFKQHLDANFEKIIEG